MRKKILEIGPVILSYGCVLLCIIGIILDIMKGKTSESIFFMHILMALGWLIVSIKWTTSYIDNKKRESLETESEN